MLQVIVKSNDETLREYDFSDTDRQEIIWRLETIEIEPTEIEMDDDYQKFRESLVNLVDALVEAFRINKLLDWMEKKLDGK